MPQETDLTLLLPGAVTREHLDRLILAFRTGFPESHAVELSEAIAALFGVDGMLHTGTGRLRFATFEHETPDPVGLRALEQLAERFGYRVVVRIDAFDVTVGFLIVRAVAKLVEVYRPTVVFDPSSKRVQA